MTLALTHANVVDTGNGEVARDLTVLINGDHIAAVTSEAPSDAQTIDAGGAYVVPGFNDMHAHALELGDPSGALQLMIAHGVTGYRQMSGSPALLAKRAAGDFGESADAPSLLYLPGALLSPLNANTAEAATAEIRAQQQQGADFIKMGMVSGEVYPAAQAEANRLGIPYGGHLPTTTMAEDAAKAGIRFIEHLGPGLGVLASCATNKDQVRRDLAGLKSRNIPNIKLPFLDRIFGVILARIVVNPQLRTSPDLVAIMGRAVEAFSEDEARRVGQVFIDHETWQCPTLIREKTNECGDDPNWAGDPDLRYMSAKTLKLWEKTAKKAGSLPPSMRLIFHRLYDAQQRLAKVLADEGVPMLTGSDVCGASWEIPGASLHREFDELATAGLSPLRVLQMTTSAPARFVGRDDFGTVAGGKRADLVLLREDPTQSVAALHDIVGVVRNGVHRSESDLDAIKDRIARDRSAG